MLFVLALRRSLRPSRPPHGLVATAALILASSAAMAAPTSTTIGINGSVDARFFGGDEKTSYFGVKLDAAFSAIGDLEFLGDFSKWSSFTTGAGTNIEHGGTDLELRIRHDASLKLFGLNGWLGVSAPRTPAQGGIHLTAGLTGNYKFGTGTSVFLDPRAVLIHDNSLVGIGLGAQQRLTDKLAIRGEFTPLIAGHNTLSTFDGHNERAATYRAELTYKLAAMFNVSAGYTNAIGDTTGFSLTPGLGSSGALFLQIGGKF